MRRRPPVPRIPQRVAPDQERLIHPHRLPIRRSMSWPHTTIPASHPPLHDPLLPPPPLPRPLPEPPRRNHRRSHHGSPDRDLPEGPPGGPQRRRDHLVRHLHGQLRIDCERRRPPLPDPPPAPPVLTPLRQCRRSRPVHGRPATRGPPPRHAPRVPPPL